MWKDKFEVKVDAHPEDGMQTVELSLTEDKEFWIVSGLWGEDLKFPNDDNVLAQIVSVCDAIINHPDNPFNR